MSTARWILPEGAAALLTPNENPQQNLHFEQVFVQKVRDQVQANGRGFVRQDVRLGQRRAQGEFACACIHLQDQVNRLTNTAPTAKQKVDFLDTSGSMQFPAMRRLSITTGSAFLIVYAVDDDNSFEVLKMCIAEIQEIRPDFQVSLATRAHSPRLTSPQLANEPLA